MDEKDLEAILMNEHYDKQRQSLLRKDFNDNGERNEQAILHSQTVGSRGPVLEQDSVLHEALQQFIHEKNFRKTCSCKRIWCVRLFSNNLSNARTYETKFPTKC